MEPTRLVSCSDPSVQEPEILSLDGPRTTLVAGVSPKILRDLYRRVGAAHQPGREPTRRRASNPGRLDGNEPLSREVRLPTTRAYVVPVYDRRMSAQQSASTSPDRVNDLLGLVAFGLAVAAAAVVGGLAVAGSTAQYAALDQPAWAPPDWLFSPVWTALYVMIAVSGWLVWRRIGIGWPLIPFAVQLVLNAAWTPLFFGLGEYGLAAVEIIVLWVAIGVTVYAFWRVHRIAALLLLPYWAWVSFATALNIAIWWMNR
jgi:translocator protein